MSENLSSVGKVINTVVRIATTGGVLWTQFGCTSTVSAPSAEPEPTTKPTTNVPTAYDAGSEYESNVAQAIRNGGDPCVDPSSILFDAGTPEVTTDDGILTICTDPTTGKDSIYNQPAGSYEVSKLDIAIDPGARTITGFMIEETETKPTETPQVPNPNDIPGNVAESQLKIIFQADILNEQIVYSPTGEVGDATTYNVTPSFRPDYERFTRNASFVESPAFQPSATLEPTATATLAPTETPAPTATPEVIRVEDYFGLGPAEITKKVYESENKTEYYFSNPDLLTATDFGEAIAQNSKAYGGPLEILSFRGVLTGYTIDRVKLLAPANPNVPIEGDVATMEFVYELGDGTVHSISIVRPGGIAIGNQFKTFKDAEDDLKIGKSFNLDLWFIPIGSQASHEKILATALENIPNLDGPQDERKFTMFLAYLNSTSRSIIIKQLKSSSYPPQSIEQGSVQLNLK